MATLFRVENKLTQVGLWYDEDGKYTEFVKSVPDYANADLPMAYEEVMAGGWHSAVDDLSTLKIWFSYEDMAKFEERGYGVYAFDVADYRIGRSETGIEHAVFQRNAVTSNYRRLAREVLL